MKKAFTLAEVLIVLAIMGILATLVSAVTVVTMPRKADVLFKRNYASFNQAVYEVINDKYLYPNSDPDIPVLSEQKDLSGSTLDSIAALFSVDKTKLDANNYFCYAVASKMHIQEGTDTEICSGCAKYNAKNPDRTQNFSENFTTADGTKFYGLCGQFHPLMGVDNEYRPIYMYVEAEKTDAKMNEKVGSGFGSKEILEKYRYGSTFDDNNRRTDAHDTYVYRIFLNASGQILVNDEPEKTQVSRAYNNK